MSARGRSLRVSKSLVCDAHSRADPPYFVFAVSVIMGLISVIAVFCEMANGTNFALVPHCNAHANGIMSGIVGGMGNLGASI